MLTEQIEIDAMQKDHIEAVLRIERACFDTPWEAVDFLSASDELGTELGVVALLDNKVVGYTVCEIGAHSLHLLNLAVDPECRREGIGRRLIEEAEVVAQAAEVGGIVCEVRETNLDAQLFFRGVGFRAKKIVREHFSNGETAYRFARKLTGVKA